MKKFYFVFLTLSMACFLQASAQQTLQKIPKDASMMAEINFNTLTRLMSVKDWDKTEAGKSMLKYIYESTGKKLKSIQDMGIDLSGSLYFYLTENDSMQYYNILMPLADASKTKNLYAQKKIQSLDNDSWLVLDEDSSAIQMWNASHLLYVRASAKDAYFENEDVARNHGITIYNPYDYDLYKIDTAEIIFDEEVAIDTSVIASPETESVEEEQEEELSIEVPQEDSFDTYDKYEEESTDHVYFKNKEIKKRIAAICAEKYVKDFFKNPTSSSILNNPRYTKSRQEGSVASFFLDNPMKLYESFLPVSKYLNNIKPSGGTEAEPMYEAFSAHLLMDEKQIKISSSLSMSPEIAHLQVEMLDRKINSKFLDYVQMDKMLGYVSYAINTKNYLKNYPQLLEKSWSNIGGVQKDELMLGLEFISFLLDEEAISDLLPGDALFLLNGLYQHEVTYTDYIYDEEYNSTPVTKTKKETLPKFLFMMSSAQNKLTDRLIKYGTDKKYISEMEGYYKISADLPVATYFAFKDNIWFFTNEEKDIVSIVNGSFKANISETDKRSLQDPNFSAYFNPQQLHKEISGKFEPTKSMTDVLNTLKKMNTIRIKTLSPTLTTPLTTELIMDVPKGNKNGLVYFMDFMNDILKK